MVPVFKDWYNPYTQQIEDLVYPDVVPWAPYNGEYTLSQAFPTIADTLFYIVRDLNGKIVFSTLYENFFDRASKEPWQQEYGTNKEYMKYTHSFINKVYADTGGESNTVYVIQSFENKTEIEEYLNLDIFKVSSPVYLHQKSSFFYIYHEKDTSYVQCSYSQVNLFLTKNKDIYAYEAIEYSGSNYPPTSSSEVGEWSYELKKIGFLSEKEKFCFTDKNFFCKYLTTNRKDFNSFNVNHYNTYLYGDSENLQGKATFPTLYLKKGTYEIERLISMPSCYINKEKKIITVTKDEDVYWEEQTYSCYQEGKILLNNQSCLVGKNNEGYTVYNTLSEGTFGCYIAEITTYTAQKKQKICEQVFCDNYSVNNINHNVEIISPTDTETLYYIGNSIGARYNNEGSLENELITYSRCLTKEEEKEIEQEILDRENNNYQIRRGLLLSNSGLRSYKFYPSWRAFWIGLPQYKVQPGGSMKKYEEVIKSRPLTEWFKKENGNYPQQVIPDLRYNFGSWYIKSGADWIGNLAIANSVQNVYMEEKRKSDYFNAENDFSVLSWKDYGIVDINKLRENFTQKQKDNDFFVINVGGGSLEKIYFENINNKQKQVNDYLGSMIRTSPYSELPEEGFSKENFNKLKTAILDVVYEKQLKNNQ